MPALEEVDSMYSMPSTPFTCCSITCATDCSTVCALAPGYVAWTTMVGSVIRGYCAMGNWSAAIAPTSRMSNAVTIAKTGRVMKNWAIGACYCAGDFGAAGAGAGAPGLTACGDGGAVAAFGLAAGDDGGLATTGVEAWSSWASVIIVGAT